MSEGQFTLQGLLGQLGYGGSAADILQQAGVTEYEKFTQFLEPALKLAGQAVGGLPAFQQELTGQAETKYGLGMGVAGQRRGEQVTGLRETFLGQMESLRDVGTPGSGAGRRAQRRARRGAGRQQTQIQQRYGLEQERLGVARGEELFGAEQQVQQRYGDILGALGGNISSLLQSLLAGGTEFTSLSTGDSKAAVPATDPDVIAGTIAAGAPDYPGTEEGETSTDGAWVWKNGMWTSVGVEQEGYTGPADQQFLKGSTEPTGGGGIYDPTRRIF